MVLVTHPASRKTRSGRALIVVAGCLALGACAGNKPDTELLSLSTKPEAVGAQAAGQTAAQAVDPTAELKKATDYWGREFSKNPRELQPALNYARNLKAMGEKQRALAVLQQASMFHAESRELANEYGRLALDLDQVSLANRLLAIADDPANPDWRVVSARGTVLAKQGKYADAIPYYERALALANDHPSVLSNLALAHAMNGEPARAEEMLRQAATTDRSSLKIRQNLALVLGLQGKYAEAKLLASRDMSPESAAENTEVLRRVVKHEPNAPGSEPTQVAQRSRNANEPAEQIEEGEPPQAAGTIPREKVEPDGPAPGDDAAFTVSQEDGFSEPGGEEDAQVSMNLAQRLPSEGRASQPAARNPAVTLAPSVR
jgi:Flp pilus assembly protein TadD